MSLEQYTVHRYTSILKKIHIRTWVGLAVIIILLPIAYFVTKNPSAVEAEWFNEGWGYRQRILITNNTTVETDVYIAFDVGDVLDTSPATFTADCGDIRFTTVDGVLLPYIINSGCDSSSTDIDVFFDSFPAEAQVMADGFP